MKNVSTFLLIVLLASACLGSISIVTATSQTNSVATYTIQIQPTYVESGNLSAYDVDYWWIPHISKDEVVLVSIVPNETVCYESWLYYSNLTELQNEWCSGTHNHDFVAPITDDYLLKIHAAYGSLNYTIDCSRPIVKEPMHSECGYLSEGSVYNYWIRSVGKGNVVLVSIVQNETVCYQSWLYYSNLTELQNEWCSGTHNHDFVAPIADDYLLKIHAKYGSLNYCIKHSALALPTKIIFKVEPNPALVGQTVSLSGNLTTSEGDPIPGEKVTIKSNGKIVGTLTTNSTGWFKASGQVKSAGTFNICVEYAGSPQYLPSSHCEILVVNKAQTWIYAIFIPNPVNSGEACKLRGILVDNFSNPIKSATVSLEYSTDYGSTWNPAGTLTTNSYGIFSKTFKAPAPRTYLVRISYAGSPSYESSNATIPLIVR